MPMTPVRPSAAVALSAAALLAGCASPNSSGPVSLGADPAQACAALAAPVLATCDAQDGLADGIVSDAVGCKQGVDVTALRCLAGASGDACLSAAQAGVDHVGSGAPANVGMLVAMSAWVEQGQAPAGPQLVDQAFVAPFAVTRARPLCEWPRWPRYQGGDAALASSFQCVQ